MKSENDTFVLIVILIVTAGKNTNEGTLRDFKYFTTEDSSMKVFL